MAIQLYDLAGADPDRRFSPYCWRTRLALAHKGLAVETIPWCFTDKDKIAFSGQGRVPVIVDGDAWVNDSWAIALYLEKTYPDRPSIFAGGAPGAIRFVNDWTDAVLQPGLFRFIVADVAAAIDPKDRAYFRQSREQRLGTTLEEAARGREDRIGAFRDVLQPLRLTLRTQEFLGGAKPNYADYIVFGAFQWARCVSPFRLLEADDPVYAWRGRLLDAFDGLAGKALGFPV
jgi:glutathione S-transferase